MGIGVSIFLLALGAILTFAIGADTVDIVNLDAVGIILMVAGLIGLALSLYATNRTTAPARPAEERGVPRDRDVY